MNSRRFILVLLLTLPALVLGDWVKDPNTGCELNAIGDSTTWDGACVGGKASGKGTVSFYKDGKLALTYKGDMEGGVWHGPGVLTTPDGTRYEGEFKDMFPHGQGVVTRASGDRFEGQFQDGLPHGQGVWTGKEGMGSFRFEGQFKKGKRHGQGVETRANGDRLEGQFQDDLPHGQVVWTGNDGMGSFRFEGQFKKGKRHGQGVETRPNGYRYEGQYKDGKKDGFGVVTGPNGERYEAQFKDNKAVDGTVVSGSSGSSEKKGNWMRVWQRWVLTTSCVSNNDFTLTGGPSHVYITNNGKDSTLNTHSSQGLAGNYSFRASASCNPFVGQRETVTCSGSFYVSGENSNGNLEIQPTACNASYSEY